MIVFLFSLVTGSVAYLLTIFHFQPILLYRQKKLQIASDLVFYADVIDAEGLADHMKQRHIDRNEALRRMSGDIGSIYASLPLWYRKYLAVKNERPMDAARIIIGLSNAEDFEDANQRSEEVLSLLRLPPNLLD